MKHSWIRSSIAAAALVLFAGCIETEIIVILRPDGSGKVVEKILIRKDVKRQLYTMVESLTPGMKPDSGAGPGDSSSFFNESGLREKASAMGEGVEFVSVEPFETGEAEGYRALYSFKNIGTLRINQNPGESVPLNSHVDGGAVREFVTFEFSPGPPAVLTVSTPSVEPAHAADSSGVRGTPQEDKLDEAEKEALEQAKQMFEGFRLAVMLQIEGKILRTNASFVKGNRITLLDMDFGKLLKSPDRLARFAQVNPRTIEEAKEIVKDVPGIKIDLNEKIEVTFR
jgi:hypothetical protein